MNKSFVTQNQLMHFYFEEVSHRTTKKRL